MLSGVFHFVLPELSSLTSHFVLHDLRSFHLERPLPSSRDPPWDLLCVLASLRAPPFEPIESCSLRDLTRKVLFLVALAMARRVGELQAVSAEVSSSSGDLFLPYLPEFRAKSESSLRPLPRSFQVRLLRDFVGSLPDELLLCPVRALRVYMSRPRSLFVSPCNPSRPLSKNALSFFIRDVIAPASSSSSSLTPSSSSSSSGSSTLSSAFQVHGVATSLAFSRNSSLSSVLEAATWSSSSVFTSFYLKDIQFSSARGFSLGPVLVAGSVV